MELIFISFLAGVLTVLAPCVFPLLPVIIGGSVQEKKWIRPVLIICSASVFIILFTVLLRFGSELLPISDQVFRIFSGLLLIGFGIISLFPNIWDKISFKLGLTAKSDELLHKSNEKKGWIGPVLTGAALGPVFTSCSPTYFVILSLALQGSRGEAFINLIFYVLGLATILLAISILGQSLIRKLKWASNPNGVFKKVIGVIFILVGIMIIFSIEKEIEAFLLNIEFYRDFYQIEYDLLDSTEMS